MDEENVAQENIPMYREISKERPSITNNEADKKENDALFNNYLLNEIKAQDDAIKSVMSISGLLIGVYATVMVNSIGKISLDLLNSTIWISLANNSQYATGPSIYLIFLVPLFFWMYALAISVMNLSPYSSQTAAAHPAASRRGMRGAAA